MSADPDDPQRAEPSSAETAPEETAPAELPSPPQSSGPRRIVTFVVAALIALALDVVSKVVVVAELPETHSPVRLLGGVFYLDQTRNSGAAFSLGTGFTVILSVVALAVVVVIARFARRLHSTGWAISLGLILGGAIGNLVDRVFRAPGVFRGHVVDWISVFGPNGEHYPIFNLADSCIVVGAILAALLALLGVDFQGRRSPSKPAP